jgi:hypothetical protein
VSILSLYSIVLFCFVLFLILSLLPSLLLVFRVSVYVFVDVVTHVFVLFGPVVCFCFSIFSTCMTFGQYVLLFCVSFATHRKIAGSFPDVIIGIFH